MADDDSTAAPEGAAASDDAALDALWAEMASKDTKEREKGPAKADPEPAAEADEPDRDEVSVAPEGAADDDGEDDPDPAEANADQDAEDPWKDAPAAVLAARDELKAELERKTHQARSATGRASAYKRQVEALRRAQEGADQPDPLAEKVKEAKENYPEVAEPLVGMIDTLKAEIAQMRETDQAAFEDHVRAEEARLEAAYPRWRDRLKPEYDRFLAWVDDQPRAARDILASNWDYTVDSAGLASLIGGYFAHRRGPTPEPQAPSPQDVRRQRQLASSASPGSRQAVRPERGEDDLDAYWKKLSDQAAREAMR